MKFETLIHNRAANLILTTALLSTAAFAQQRQALSLGYANTPLLQAVKGGRYSVDGRSLLRSKDRKEGARLAKTDLRNVDMLAVNLDEIDITSDDVEIIQAAKQAGVPMVIENANGEKMASLFGIGVAGSLVVVESDPRTKRTRMNLADPMQMEDVPGYVQMPQPYANFGDRVKFVNDILEKRPFTSGARAQSHMGTCSAAPFNGKDCTENEIKGQPVYFCPARAVTLLAYNGGNKFSVSSYYLANVATTYSCAWGMTYVDPQWEAGLYKVNMKINTQWETRYYAIVRALGGWGVVGANGSGDPIRINTDNEQFPIFTQYKVSMMPSYGAKGLTPGMPSGWSLDNSKPSNENKTGTLTSTTGWTASAGISAGGGPEGPTGGVNAQISYEQSQTSTITLSDWSVLNSAGSPNAVLTYYMSRTTGCNGAKQVAHELGEYLGSKMTVQCNAGGAYRLTRTPVWSAAGNHYSGMLAETVWVGRTADPFQVNLRVDAKVNNVQLWSYNPVGVGWWNFSYVQDDSRGFPAAFYYNPAALTLTK